MKIFIDHDSDGTIASIGVPAAGFSDSVGLKPEPGQAISALEVDAITHPHQFEKYLRECRVDLKSGQPKLVKR